MQNLGKGSMKGNGGDARSGFKSWFIHQSIRVKRMGKSNEEMINQAILGVSNEWGCKIQ